MPRLRIFTLYHFCTLADHAGRCGVSYQFSSARNRRGYRSQAALHRQTCNFLYLIRPFIFPFEACQIAFALSDIQRGKRAKCGLYGRLYMCLRHICITTSLEHYLVHTSSADRNSSDTSVRCRKHTGSNRRAMPFADRHGEEAGLGKKILCSHATYRCANLTF